MKFILYISSFLILCMDLYPQGACTNTRTNLYMFNTLMINPAYAGVKESFSFSAMYGKKWMGWEGHNDLQAVTGHTPMKNNKIALGLLVQNDRQGFRNKTDAYFFYNYRIEVGGGKLGMGLRTGGNFYINRLSEADLPQGQDLAFVDDKLIMPNFGAGVYYFSDLIYLGLSVPSFFIPAKGYNGFEHDYNQYNIMLVGGVLIRFSDQFKIKPSSFVNYTPGMPPEKIEYHLNTSLIFLNDALWFGGSYKSSKGIVGILEFQITKQIRMGYAYEFPTGDLTGFCNGTHEFLLRYDFSYIVRAENPGFFW